MTDVVAVGRQPVVDREGALIGFELLFRPVDTSPTNPGDEQMTASVVLGALTIGVDRLVGDKLMFCNAGRGVLLGDTPITLPPRRTVVEVLETVTVDEPVLEGCQALVAAGYTLALDDFTWFDGADRLLDLASIVKLDVQAVAVDEMPALMRRCRDFDVRLLAEKVETADEMEWAMELGFELFQGYGVERPARVEGCTLTTSAISQVQLATMLLTTELDLDELEDVLRREPGLVVQVIHLASIGAQNGLRRRVRSLREALVLLGTRRLRQWIGLRILGSLPGRSPDGLATALVRAEMVETLCAARRVGTPETAYTVGLLSSLDLLLGRGADDLHASLPVDPELKAAAFGRTGPLGELVTEVADYWQAVSVGRLPAEVAHDLDQAAAAAFPSAVAQAAVVGSSGS